MMLVRSAMRRPRPAEAGRAPRAGLPADSGRSLTLPAGPSDDAGRFYRGSTQPAMKLDVVTGLFVLMLSTFIGLDVIRRVSRLLHTPLMSLTNAISAIAVVGAVILAGEQKSTLSTVLGAVAVFASTTNIISGFLITDRMLKMFKKREPGK
jgi:NAD(P) transhydrogenase subunit alpha